MASGDFSVTLSGETKIQGRILILFKPIVRTLHCNQSDGYPDPRQFNDIYVIHTIFAEFCFDSTAFILVWCDGIKLQNSTLYILIFNFDIEIFVKKTVYRVWIWKIYICWCRTKVIIYNIIEQCSQQYIRDHTSSMNFTLQVLPNFTWFTVFFHHTQTNFTIISHMH